MSDIDNDGIATDDANSEEAEVFPDFPTDDTPDSGVVRMVRSTCQSFLDHIRACNVKRGPFDPSTLEPKTVVIGLSCSGDIIVSGEGTDYNPAEELADVSIDSFRHAAGWITATLTFQTDTFVPLDISTVKAALQRRLDEARRMENSFVGTIMPLLTGLQGSSDGDGGDDEDGAVTY